MGNNEKSTVSQILTEEQGYVLRSYQIDGETYQGYCSKNAKDFILKSKETEKSVYTIVRDISAEENPQGRAKGIVDYPDRYPHLQLPIGGTRNSTNTQEFIFYSQPDENSFEKLETVLFGKNMSLTQRFLLSLSMAAAVSELEAVFAEIPVKQLRMDAFLVDMKKCVVNVSCRKLSGPYTEEENKTEFEKMAKLGLMPPEWYENPNMSTATVEVLRHFLAVCVFRFLCADDPFDGGYTLQAYPYRGREAIRGIYGKNAKCILDPGGPNRANSYIGLRARTIFAAICPRLKKLFEDTFVNGVQDPALRPPAKAWMDNQKHMVSWFMVFGNEWRIPDLVNGSGVFENTEYLMIDNGIMMPLVNEKPLYQFMFDPSDVPVNETMIGKIQVKGFCAKLIFSGKKESEIVLHPEKNKLPGNLEGITSSAPWKEFKG